MPSSLGLSVALPFLARFKSFGLVSLQMMMIIGMLVATSAVAGKVLSERFWLEISCPMPEMIGCYCGAAAVLVEAVALSYFFMKMRMQAAAACAAALEGVHMSDFTWGTSSICVCWYACLDDEARSSCKGSRQHRGVRA